MSLKSYLLPAILCCLFITDASDVFAAKGDHPDKNFEQAVISVIRSNPSIIIDAFKGREDQLYDLMQKGLEMKKQATIRKRRIELLKKPIKPRKIPSRPIWGNPDGDVRIVAYSDFQCAGCAKANPIIRQLLRSDPGISYEYRHNPLGFHKMSVPAAKFYEAAAIQGKYIARKFSQLLFINRKKVEKQGRKALTELAVKAGADKRKLLRDADSPAVEKLVKEDIAEAKSFGFTASPVFVVGGTIVTGAAPLEELKDTVKIVRKYGK